MTEGRGVKNHEMCGIVNPRKLVYFNIMLLMHLNNC